MADTGFEQRLRRRLEADEAVLDRLAKGPEKVVVRHDLPDGYTVYYEDTEHVYAEDPLLANRLAGVSSVVSAFKGDTDALLSWAVWLSKKGLDWQEERRKAALRGSRAHRSLEALCAGSSIFWDIIPDEERGYHLAIEKFWDKYQPKPILSEVVVASRTHRVAGTFDLVAELPKHGVCLIDLKTSKHIGDDYHCQLAAYETLGLECQRFDKPDAKFILQADKNGKFRLISCKMDDEDFQAALNVWRRTKKGKDLK